MAKITVLLLMVLSSQFGHSVEVQGHRGSRGTFPENTLPAFANAISNGVDALELDILASKEGELVIYHDYFVNPQLSIYLDGKQVPDNLLLCQLPLAEIKKIDCGRKSNPNFPQQHPIPGTKIPTLKELFL
ncbi:MAG TPA: glycerophosphodiester phosphodiesterase family protein, partial [Chlamydiales bacterium]|nr:glycerophosphodiester phosphodiesterase family protein [Chlamydiales bacterium]